ncbi:hypothetical protein ACJW30_01G230100 [Castanea mollissima]
MIGEQTGISFAHTIAALVLILIQPEGGGEGGGGVHEGGLAFGWVVCGYSSSLDF